MESHTSVRARLGEFADRDDPASTLSWPPPADGIHREVVDLPADEISCGPEGSSVEPERPSIRGNDLAPHPSRTAGPRPLEAARTEPAGPAPARAARPVRVAIGVLAALALAEGILLVLLVTGNGTVRQMTAASGERLAQPQADVRASDAAKPATAAASAAGAQTARAAAAGAAAGKAAGQLQVQTDRPGAAVIVDGEPRGTAPLTVQGLAPGAHRVRVASGERFVEQTVVVQPDVATALVMPLGGGPAAAGWMDLAMPFEVQIFEQGRLVGTSAQARLQFPAGEHKFELANDALGYRAVETVRVRAGQVVEVRPAVPTGLLHINATPWAEVWIDGRQAGTTPLGNVKVPLGTHEIRFRHPELGDETRRVLVTATEPARVSVDFRP